MIVLMVMVMIRMMTWQMIFSKWGFMSNVNQKNVIQIVKMSIKLSKCHNIKCHVLSECVG